MSGVEQHNVVLLTLTEIGQRASEVVSDVDTGVGGAVISAGDSAGWDTATSVATIFGLTLAVAALAVATASRLPQRVAAGG